YRRRVLASAFCPWSAAHRDLLPFPTRRSSDLIERSVPLTVKRPLPNAMSAASASSAWAAILVPFVMISSEALPITTLAMRMERRSEEHTSELQSRSDLVCRLLLEKKNKVSP